MKSESMFVRLYQTFVRLLFRYWIFSFKDPKERAEKVSELLSELVYVNHQGSALNSSSAQELMKMRYPRELAEIENSVRALSAAAYEENPYLYTECTKKALSRVFVGMKRARAVLLAWVEENPALRFHNHSSSLTFIQCRCEVCVGKLGVILRDLHGEAGRHLEAMTDELRYKLENVPVEERGTLQ